MKIMLITNLFSPYARGGAERVVETIAGALVDAGHQVVIVTTEREGAHVEDGKYRVYRYRPNNLFWYGDIESQPIWRRAIWRLKDIFSYSLVRPVTRIIMKEHPHLVLTHNIVGMGYRIPEMLKRFRVRHIHTIHDVQLVVPSGQLWHNARLGILHQLYTWLCRRRFGSPALVVSPSQWLLDFYTSRRFFRHSEKLVLQNPVRSQNSAAAENCDPHEGVLRVLYVGQLEVHKGILFLIEAIKKLQLATGNAAFGRHPASGGGWQLAIVGSGSLESRVREMVVGDARVTVHGAIPHDRVAEFYAKTDVVVVSSLVAENQPTVILEAFSHGAPVVASRIGGIPELVEDGKVGALFTPGDTDDFCRALGVISNKKTLAAMQQALENQHIGKSAPEYVTALLQAIEPGK